MLKYSTICAAPLSLLLLAGCAASGNNTSGSASQSGNTPVNSQYGANTGPSNVTTSTPGYIALKEGNYGTAGKDFRASNYKTPNSAFDELDLGAAYQNQGRMDLAEPFYRQAMTHGHNIATSDTTTQFSRGHTVEEIACQNLAMGLAPASVEGTATPCQTTVVIALVAAPGPVAPMYRSTSYNTYFEFDKATMTNDGQTITNAAVKEALDNPTLRVELVGKASSIGTEAYNMTLSRQRADTISDAMVAAGIPRSRIDIRWVGETELPVAEKEGTREPLNRVVETTVR